MMDNSSVPISALQHYVYCPRQCALIHTEREWAENALTFLGRQEHKRVESALGTTKGRLREARSVHLESSILNIHGVSDVVEYEQLADGIRITPIEYKHGKPKIHDADKIQLCAQALCLEEMHDCHIDYGFLFYHSLRRREKIEFTEELRQATVEVIAQTMRMLEKGDLPLAFKRDECKAYSLFEKCLPIPSDITASAYNNKIFCAALKDETTS